MKRIVLIIPIAAVTFSCSQLDLEDKIVTLQQENKELQELSLTKDQDLTEFLEAFSDVEKNLAQIRERELNIELENGDATETTDIRQRVNEDIAVISQLMTENKQTIDELNAKINRVSGKNSKLRKALNSAKEELIAKIEEKDVQISELKAEIDSMDHTVQQLSGQMDTLQLANEAQVAIIEGQTEMLHTAYYTTGSSKDLVAGDVLTKEGGFLGLGKSELLSDDFNAEKFNKIDITSTTTIPLNSSKAELITNHPTDSYVIEGDTEKSQDRLVIIDPDRFWTSSKYLVVVTN